MSPDTCKGSSRLLTPSSSEIRDCQNVMAASMSARWDVLSAQLGGTTSAWLFHSSASRRHPRRQDLLRFTHRQASCLPDYLVGYPFRKWNGTRPVSSASGVFVPQLGQPSLVEPRSEFHERRPQPPMDIRNLSLDQLTNQYVVAFSDRLGEAEDLVTLRVAPPAATNWAPYDRLGKGRDGTSSSLQHDTMPLDEGQSFLRAHPLILAAALIRAYHVATRAHPWRSSAATAC